MKAKPLKLIKGKGYVDCSVDEATHVRISMPSIAKIQTLPVITKGSRDNTPCWTWNGSIDKPTLRPSVSVQGYCYDEGTNFKCHSWINDGRVQFLGDCTHELANKTVDLLDIN